MDKRDFKAEHPAPRRVVDQLGPGAGEIGESGADVVDFVRDVVHAGPALREEAPDGRVLTERPEQLDPARADADRRGLDSLFLDALAVLERRAEKPRIRIDCAVEIVNGDPDMVDRAGRGHRVDRMRKDYGQSEPSALATTRGTPTVSDARDSGSTSAKSSSTSSRPSVSFSSSEAAIRSSGGRCFVSSRTASSYAPS